VAGVAQQRAYPETVAILRDLRAQVDFLRPYDLIETGILTRHDGPPQACCAAGIRAEDGINGPCSRRRCRMSARRSRSLTGFLVWMQTGLTSRSKRQIENASISVRVMDPCTGPRGLEALS